MKNKALSLILVVVLAFSLAAPAFAANFTDVNGHWAKDYLLDLADRGFLSGYGDGTMKPDKNITACETLALLSRFYTPGDTSAKLIAADFGKYVSETVSSTLSWAYDELEICLAAGIVTKAELKTLSLTSEIAKQDLSVFLVRALQLQSEAAAQSGTALSFDDANDISDSCKGSVAQLVSLKIVNGDDNNNFSPKLSVTRAVVATMISRTLSYLKTAGKTLVIPAYDGVTRTEGIIVSAAGNKLVVQGYDGYTRVYSVSSSSSVTVNGAIKTLSSVYTGCSVTVTAKDATVTIAQIVSDATVTWVQNPVYSIFSSTTLRYLYLTDPDSGDITKYNISSGAEITLNGTAAALSSIVNGYFATLKIVDGSVTKLTAFTSDGEVTGAISDISYGTTVTLTVADKEGGAYQFQMAINDLPTIYRGTTAITIDRLSVGESVTVTVKNCAVTTIVTESSENSITGELTSITSTTDGTKWVITQTDGTVSTLTVDENTGVYRGSTAILLSDIQAGDTVTVVVYGSTITEIYLVSSTNSSTKVSGKVLTTDTSKRIITVLTDSNKLVYVDTTAVGYMINADTGRSITLSTIAADAKIVAYGTYTNSTSFSAKSIVIEG